MSISPSAIVTFDAAICTDDAVCIQESTNRRVLITRTQVIEPCFCIVVITTVTERIVLPYGACKITYIVTHYCTFGIWVAILFGYIACFVVIINIRLTCNGIFFADKLTERILGVFEAANTPKGLLLTDLRECFDRKSRFFMFRLQGKYSKHICYGEGNRL